MSSAVVVWGKYLNLPADEQGHNFDMRNHKVLSTRTQTKQSGVFVRSTGGSQSLARGMRLLRAFLTGASELTNAELAERCDLPRPTVSRLTRSLVDGGFLEFDAKQSLYRLAPIFLSLSASYHQGHGEFASVLPLLKEMARRESVNASLLVRNGMQMVYLASYREGRGPIRRMVDTGSRIPIDSYASGHALIAAMSPAERAQLLDQLAKTHETGWSELRTRIHQSIVQYKRSGYCTLESVPGLFAFATALRTPGDSLCALVLTSSQTREARSSARLDLPSVLLNLTQEIKKSWEIS